MSKKNILLDVDFSQTPHITTDMIPDIVEKLIFDKIIKTNKFFFNEIGLDSPGTISGIMTRRRKLPKKFLPKLKERWGEYLTKEYLEKQSFSAQYDSHNADNNTYSEVPLVTNRVTLSYRKNFQDEVYLNSLPKLAVQKQSEGRVQIAFEYADGNMDDDSIRAFADGDIYLCEELPLKFETLDQFFKRFVFLLVLQYNFKWCRITNFDPEQKAITASSYNPFFEDEIILIKDIKQLFYVKELVMRRPIVY